MITSLLQKIPFPDDLRWRQVVFILYILFITIISLAPSDVRSLPVRHIDKVGHFLAYVVMGVLALVSFEGWGKRGAAFVFTLVVAFLLEWGQGFVPGRLATVTDGITNVLGLVAGVLVYWGYARRGR